LLNLYAFSGDLIVRGTTADIDAKTFRDLRLVK
jgi:hypothetical protein